MKIDWSRYRLRVTKPGLGMMGFWLACAVILSGLHLAAPFLNARFGWRLGSSADQPWFWLGVALVVFTAFLGLWVVGMRKRNRDA